MIIVITRPDFFEGEAERITELLRSGRADLMHIRKPQASREEVMRLLISLPGDIYDRLVLHDQHQLAVECHLHGIHLNHRNPQPPAGWTGAVSISCHSFQELAECHRQSFAYMSLSPIFDSISKQGYRSAFTPEQIAEAAAKGLIDERVMALGGVTFDRVEEVMKMGFGGAMILGDAWR
ncbi:MAG: thiamine phosphate synthase [Prevotella sp.]|nr:thiamine phosphate synthase [Prevotella sp.]